MQKTILMLTGMIVLILPATADAQKAKQKGKYDPPMNVDPPPEVMQQIQAKTDQLAAKIAELRKHPKHTELLPDVEIYLRAARNIVQYKEFFAKNSGKATLDCLARGLERADQLASGDAPWTTLAKQNVLRAFRSKIDGTAQPYGVTYPAGYGKDGDRKWRVDVVLHGRGSTLTEVSFLSSHSGAKKPDPSQDWVQIDIFGRGNNAYRWSGEMDVFEALDAFFADEAAAGHRNLIDRGRVVLRGFSMGGAGTWQLGLRHPDKWCVMGPGAGFTTTHDYAWKGKKELPDYQEKCLRIYDAIDYVENARMIPIVAYSGGDDPQKLAADNIEKRLKELKINTMTHLVKPGVGHRFDADYFAKANALWSQYAATGRNLHPKKVSFVTYTTKAFACDWILINGLEKTYERAYVDAEMLSGKVCVVKTSNVRCLLLIPPLNSGYSLGSPKHEPPIIQIDGQQVKVEPRFMIMNGVCLEKKSGKWQGQDRVAYLEKNRDSEKTPGHQGPIDDAFASGFICISGTGETWHPATQKYVDAKLKAFKYDWGKHWRGELPLTNEYGVTPNEIMDKHLILFGDPSSNFLLANILPKLPLKWTKDEIEFAGKKYKSSEHVPVMIFPNPLNPQRYVVLNTGHTFPSEDYVKTNALLYPRLGDYAILRLTPTPKNAAAYEVATAGLFNEFWQVENK